MAAKTKKKAGAKKTAAKKPTPARGKPGKKTTRSKPKAAAKKPATKKAAATRPVAKKGAPKRTAAKPPVPPKPAKKSASPKPVKPAKLAKKSPDGESLELRTVLPASPERVLAAWLDSAEHSAFTGSDATVDARVGGKHTAWNGYIEGEILEIQDGRRVVMSWRTTEFDPKQPDSIVVVEAHPHPAGTELRVVHTELPRGGAEKYGQGWREFYFVPMASHFAR